MTFPLFAQGVFGSATGLLLGTLIGIGFGFTLERAGFGRARNLAAQFYLTDLRVLKVMFSAIVTALTGMAVLSGIGLLDFSQVTVPETFLWPQLAGGLLLGAGFIVSGYCPGTAVAATASGNLDGAAAILGMMAGSLAFGFGFGFGPLERFYKSGSMGVVRLSDLLGVPLAVVAAGVVGMAILAFTGGEKLERIFARRAGEPAPESPRSVKVRVFGGFTVAALLALTVLALPARERSDRLRASRSIEPVALAELLLAAPQDLWLLDLRAPGGSAGGRIPGSMALPADDPKASFAGNLSPTRALVVYAQDDPESLPPGVLRFPGEIAVLHGGYAAWRAQLLAPPQPPASPTPALLAEFRLKSALHSRFTGAAAVEPPRIDPKAAAPAATSPRKGGGC